MLKHKNYLLIICISIIGFAQAQTNPYDDYAEIHPDSLLFKAIFEHDSELFQQSLEKSANVNARWRSCNIDDKEFLYTPLHFILLNPCDWENIPKQLLEKGANPNLQSFKGYTPFQNFLFYSNEDIYCVYDNNWYNKKKFEKIKLDSYGNSFVHLVVNGNNYENIHLLLSENKKNHTIKNKKGLTPMDIAIAKNKDAQHAIYEIMEEMYFSDEIKNKKRIELLIEAIKVNKYEEVKKLINKKIDINDRLWYDDEEAYGVTCNKAIHYAAMYDTTGIITEFLLKKGANPESLTFEHLTPIQLSLRNKNPEIFKILTKYNAKTNAKTKDGKSLIHFAIDYNVSVDFLKLILQYQGDIKVKDKEKRNILEYAVYRNAPEEIINLLIGQGFYITLKNKRHNILQTAIDYYPNYIIKLLITNCTNIRFRDKNRQEVLNYAIIKSDLDIVKHIIYKGGKADSRDYYTAKINNKKDIQKYLLKLGINKFESILDRQLLNAVDKNDIEKVKKLISKGALSDSSSNYTEKKHGWFYGDVYYLNLVKSVKIAQELINKGLDVNFQSGYSNEAPIHAATRKENIPLVKLLLKSGAIVNAINNSGKTALHIAVNKSNLNLLDLLIKNGADINITDNYGTTAYAIAKDKIKQESARFLIKSGAKRNSTLDSLFIIAVKNDDIEKTKQLLKKGANIHTRDRNEYVFQANTALHLVKSKKNAQLLISNNANINLRNSSGEFPILAVENKEVRKWFYEKGLFPEKYKNILDSCYKNNISNIERTIIKNETDNNLNNMFYKFFHYTALERSFSLTKKMIEKGANVNTNKWQWQKAYGQAVNSRYFKTEEEKLATAKLLVKDYTIFEKQIMARGIGENNVEKYYEKPVKLISAKNVEEVKQLISNGADINARNSKGETALHYFAKNNNEICTYLAKKGANIEAEDYENQTPIFSAVKAGNIETTQSLINLNANINHIDINGKGLLSVANYETEKLIKLLINKGLDVNACDNKHQTVLFYSTNYTDFPKRVSSLLKFGVNILHQNRRGESYLVHILKNAKKYQYERLLPKVKYLYAINPEIIKLNDLKNKNAKDYANQIAEKEFYTGFKNCFSKSSLVIQAELQMNDKVIMALKTDTAISNKTKANVLKYAILTDNSEIIDYLCSLDEKAFLNYQDTLQQTALIYAIFIGNIKAAEKLISAGSNVNLADIDGNTALTLAEYKEYSSIINLLNKKNAKNINLKYKPKIVIPTGHSYQSVADIKFSEGQKYMLSIETGDNSILWDYETERQIAKFESKGSMGSINTKLSPNGKFLITNKRIIDIATERTIVEFDDKNNNKLLEERYGVKLNQNTEKIKNPDFIKTTNDSLGYYKKLSEIRKREYNTWKGWGKGFSISKNKKYALILTYKSKTAIELWDIQKNEIVQKFIEPDAASVFISPNNNELLIGTNIGTVKVFDFNTKQLIRTYNTNNKEGAVIQIGTSPDKKHLYTTFYGGRAIRFWDITKCEQTKIFEPKLISVHDFEFSTDGNTLAFVSDSILNIWDIKGDRNIKTMQNSNNKINDIEFSKNNKQLLSASYNSYIKLWDVTQAKHLNTYKGNLEGICDIVFSSDNKNVISFSGNKSVDIVNLKSGKEITDSANFISIYKSTLKSLPYIKNYQIDRKTYLKQKSYSKSTQSLRIKSKKGKSDYIEYEKLFKYFTVKNKTNYIQNIKIKSEKYTINQLWNYSRQLKKRCGLSDNLTYKFKPELRFATHGRRIQVWNKKTNTLLKTFDEQKSEIARIKDHPNGKHIVSGSYEDVLYFWDVNTGKEVAKVFFLKNNDWMIVCPDGYYSCSQGTANKISFKMGNHLYSFEQFDLQFNRPDIVLKRLELANSTTIEMYKKAYEKRLQKTGFNEKMFNNDWHIPEISIKNKIIHKTDSANYELNVFAKDKKYKLDRINVWINDVPIYGIKGIDLRNENTKFVNKKLSFLLNKGKNKIQISALNQKGAESYKQTVYVDNLSKDIVKPDLHVVVVGVSDYKNSSLNLSYASKDANDIANMFKQNKSTYNKTHTKYILDKEATRENILKVKKSLMNTNVDDQVVLFFAGHGVLEGYDYYLATTDIDVFDIPETALAYEDFENILDGIPARKKLLLIDACHSGEVEESVPDKKIVLDDDGAVVTIKGTTKRAAANSTKVNLSSSFKLMKVLFADLRRGTGTTIISSAAGSESAIEGAMILNGKLTPINNGVFTYSFMKGLYSKKADANNNGTITISEIKDYVSNQVSKITGGYQHPTSRRENLETDFIIW